MMLNYLQLCSKSISERSILALDEAGKSRLDAFNKEKCYLFDQVSDEVTLEGVIPSASTNPYDDYVFQEFVCSLNGRERNVLFELMAGYTVRETCKDLRKVRRCRGAEDSGDKRDSKGRGRAGQVRSIKRSAISQRPSTERRPGRRRRSRRERSR